MTQTPPQPQYAYQAPVPVLAYGVPGPGEPFNGAADPSDLTRPLYGASLPQSLKRFFSSYVRFGGRASRSEFWWMALVTTVLQAIPVILLMIGLGLVLDNSGGTYQSSAFDPSYGGAVITPENEAAAALGSTLCGIAWILILVLGLGLLLPTIALIWRRLHDANFPGPLYFLGLIPMIGPLVLLVFMFLSPNPSGRRFDT